MSKRLSRKQKTAAVIGAVGLVAAAGSGVAVASGDDNATERPIQGGALEKAQRAALEETGGGTVTGTEVDDEESKYEVEVTLPDGGQVDVQLDDQFDVVSNEADHEDDAGDEGE